MTQRDAAKIRLLGFCQHRDHLAVEIHGGIIGCDPALEAVDAIL